MDEPLTLDELLEEIAGGLFTSAYRFDRIIIAYPEQCNIDIARDYIVGEACTYEPFTCKEITLIGGKNQDPVTNLFIELGDPDDHCIYSIKVEGKWTKQQWNWLGMKAGKLWPYQMLWWMRKEDWLLYSPYMVLFRLVSRTYFIKGLVLRELDPGDVALVNRQKDEHEPQPGELS